VEGASDGGLRSPTRGSLALHAASRVLRSACLHSLLPPPLFANIINHDRVVMEIFWPMLLIARREPTVSCLQELSSSAGSGSSAHLSLARLMAPPPDTLQAVAASPRSPLPLEHPWSSCWYFVLAALGREGTPRGTARRLLGFLFGPLTSCLAPCFPLLQQAAGEEGASASASASGAAAAAVAPQPLPWDGGIPRRREISLLCSLKAALHLLHSALAAATSPTSPLLWRELRQVLSAQKEALVLPASLGAAGPAEAAAALAVAEQQKFCAQTAGVLPALALLAHVGSPRSVALLCPPSTFPIMELELVDRLALVAVFSSLLDAGGAGGGGGGGELSGRELLFSLGRSRDFVGSAAYAAALSAAEAEGGAGAAAALASGTAAAAAAAAGGGGGSSGSSPFPFNPLEFGAVLVSLQMGSTHPSYALQFDALVDKITAGQGGTGMAAVAASFAASTAAPAAAGRGGQAAAAAAAAAAAPGALSAGQRAAERVLRHLAAFVSTLPRLPAAGGSSSGGGGRGGGGGGGGGGKAVKEGDVLQQAAFYQQVLEAPARKQLQQRQQQRQQQSSSGVGSFLAAALFPPAPPPPNPAETLDAEGGGGGGTLTPRRTLSRLQSAALPLLPPWTPPPSLPSWTCSRTMPRTLQ
jgi:hypothetical protein